MTESMKGKVAAITGAASGIGLACARALIAEGAKVVLIDRAKDRLTQVCAELGPSALPLVMDLLQPAEVSTMLPQILERAGGLDIFHANAGAYVGGDVLEGDPDEWDRVLNLNVNAAFRSVHAVLPHMVGAEVGRHHLHQFDRGDRAGGLGADLHRLQVRGAGVRSHDPAPARQARRARRRGGPGPGRDGAAGRLAEGEDGEALASGSLMQPKEVADAVLFMLTRPRNVTIRDLVILPNSVDL